LKTSKIDYDRYLDIQIDMCLVFKLGGLIQKQLFFAKSGYPFGGEKHHILSDYHRSCGLCEICFIYKDRSTLTEVLVFPDLCSKTLRIKRGRQSESKVFIVQSAKRFEISLSLTYGRN